MTERMFYSPPWWLSPALFPLFYTLPEFLIATIVGGQTLYMYEIYSIYIDPSSIALGSAAILMLAFGAALPAFSGVYRNSVVGTLSRKRVISALRVLAVTSVVANCIMFSTFLEHIDLIVQTLQGSSVANFELSEAVGRIPGITSFVQMHILFFSLYAAAKLDPSFQPTNDIKYLFFVLLAFAIFRAFFATERLALIEVAVVSTMPRISFRVSPGILRGGVPFLGTFGVLSLFAAGEYFRSWQYYKDFGFQFPEFILVRFAGYFSTSVNNGAGLLANFETVGYPYYTAIWFYKLPIWELIGIELEQPAMTLSVFLKRFASEEFNNPGGLYAPMIDFGIPGGLLFLVVLGTLSGMLYQNFCRGGLLGLLIYPYWFVGYLDPIRIFLWGDSRSVPVFIAAFPLVFYLQRVVWRRH